MYIYFIIFSDECTLVFKILYWPKQIVMSATCKKKAEVAPNFLNNQYLRGPYERGAQGTLFQVVCKVYFKISE